MVDERMARRPTDAPVDDHWLPTASHPLLAGRVAIPVDGQAVRKVVALRRRLAESALAGRDDHRAGASC
jgi:hypothetical protein